MRKPVAMLIRDAIYFCNAQPLANGGLQVRCSNERFRNATRRVAGPAIEISFRVPDDPGKALAVTASTHRVIRPSGPLRDLTKPTFGG